ncbi:MAG TPA: DNA mismatch repair endonuclease MutL [bacterium]|nr:DNA mismatch repair endonuclease MutL [bacterium]
MATKIKLLPEQVANQIAAGEVVDRPASVVKELIENSLDAGARRLMVEIEQGGRRLVRVADDGDGMGREDALLCLERHATSKIRRLADLFSIGTLGFRGEALPSIASVSDLTLVTREEDALAGVKVVVEAGVIKDVADAGVPRGTEVTVRRLFFNVPARRKFLKSVETEFSHVTTLVSNMALARPDVHVTLLHNGRVIFDLPGASDLSGRLRHALGADALHHLVPINQEHHAALGNGSLKVHGYISLPSYTRASTRSLHVFVNQRFVRDRLINHAVFEAYRGLVPKNRYPLVVLFIDLPPDAVDVNVHPAKHEVRFREQNAVHDAVMNTLLAALKNADRAGAAPVVDDETARPFRGTRPGNPIMERPVEPPPAGGVADALQRYYRRMDGAEGRETWTRHGESRAAAAKQPEGQGAPRPRGEPALEFSELRVIGQAAGTFLLAESQDSLIIIDQHAAHEKVVYERLKQQFRDESLARQPLLFPATVELTYEEARRVEAHLDTLARLGLEVEPFGGNTVAVKALPALLSGADAARLLLEVVDRLEGPRGKAAVEERLDDVFAVMACHSVVRAHQVMSVEEIRSLLRAMEEAEFPGHCPHGRDVVVRIKFKDLGKWFGR